VSVKLSSKCVEPGGSQTLTVVTTPGYFLAYNTQYSDGSDGSKHGGVGTAQVPSSGTYRATFVVTPDAPRGQAIVFIAISGRKNTTAFRQPTFMVGNC
jgi:hypothetical protein